MDKEIHISKESITSEPLMHLLHVALQFFCFLFCFVLFFVIFEPFVTLRIKLSIHVYVYHQPNKMMA